MCIDNCKYVYSTLCVLSICMCILHIVICISLLVCNGTVYMLIVSALDGARSQEFHSSRHMCCDDVTIKVI